MRVSKKGKLCGEGTPEVHASPQMRARLSILKVRPPKVHQTEAAMGQK